MLLYLAFAVFDLLKILQINETRRSSTFLAALQSLEMSIEDMSPKIC